ncbi:hypothetical protein pdam_00000266, partial [Pocillopora damicornis]
MDEICPSNAWIVVSCDFVAVVLSDFTFTVYKVGSVAPVSFLSYARAAASILFHRNGRNHHFDRYIAVILHCTRLGTCTITSPESFGLLVSARVGHVHYRKNRYSSLVLIFFDPTSVSLVSNIWYRPKSPACDPGGTELVIFDTQGTLQ